MAPREYRQFLDDILAAIRGIRQAVADKTFEEFCSDWLLKHGVQRGIEIISEASRSVPEEIQALRPDIPWRKVRGIGNVLRHEYHGLSDKIVRGVVVDELPRLETAVIAILASIGDGA
jgi:uncharacterized protein with HEPN domain